MIFTAPGANFVDADFWPYLLYPEGPKWHHHEKKSIFQSCRYFHHDVTTEKETSY